MQIHGMNRITLLDYPEHIAATLFTGGCNFRCPFCHNAGLVLDPGGEPIIPEDEIFSYLMKRKGVLTGVCITGGEPTLQPDLADFIRKIKALGYLVKLDTNGYHPEVLEALIEEQLLDYIAMDIKTSLDHYPNVTGVSSMDLDKIDQSVRLLMTQSVPYEFRTTVVQELHSEEDFISIGKWIAGCDHYYLQSYEDTPNNIQSGFHACDKDTLLHFLELVKPTVPNASLRGVD